MNESKKDNFFLQEYYVEQRPENCMVIEEAWLERGSFNNRKGLIVTRDAEGWCQLVFKIQEDDTAKFTRNNFLRWSMREKESGAFVGLHGRGEETEYFYTLPERDNCVVPDSLVFNLFSEVDNKDVSKGEIVFIIKPNKD